MNKRWVQLGVVGKPHGLRGAFYISGREGNLPDHLKQFSIGTDASSAATFKLKSCRLQSGRPLVELASFTNRDDVEKVKGQAIWCLRDELNLNDEEEYLWSDLIDKRIVDSDGELIGKLVSVQNHGASDIVTVRSKTGSQLDIPFVSAYFDMSFKASDDELSLLVSKDIFDEAWYERS